GSTRRGVNPASWRSRQKSFRGLAKWAAAAAETRPGLIPQKITFRSSERTSGTALFTLPVPGRFPPTLCGFALGQPAFGALLLVLLEEPEQLFAEEPTARAFGTGLPDHRNRRVAVTVEAGVGPRIAPAPA